MALNKTLGRSRAALLTLGPALLASACAGGGSEPPPTGSGGSDPRPGGSTSVGGAGSGGMSTAAGMSAGGSTEAGGSSGRGGSVAGAGAGRAGRGAGGRAAGNAGAAGQGMSGASGAATGGVSGMGAGGSPGDVVKSKGCGFASPPKSGDNITLDVNGTSRTYNLGVPDGYDANHPYRLILSFHWLNGTAANVSKGGGATGKPFYGLWDLSAGSTIFVAPQGISNSWPDSGNSKTAEGTDLKFVRALVTELTSTLCIDESRIFAEGFSMGGSMSYAVACAMGDMIRGVAVHSGGPMSGCVNHDTPVAYFMTHGTEDTVCTYPSFGVPQVNDFAKVNGCTAQDMPDAPADGGKTANCIDFEGCSAGHPTRACIFQGPHTPSPPNASTTWVPAETWKFISQF
jgi:polyhydroxybutyrate depolymerase